jgi:hypothetical protein
MILDQLYCRQLDNYKKLSNFLFDGIKCQEGLLFRIDNTQQLIGLYRREHIRKEKKCTVKKDNYYAKECAHIRGLTQTDENWAIQNPFCLSLEDWEKYSIDLCQTLNLKFQALEKKCDIVLEITTKTVPCDVLVVFTLTEQICKIGYRVSFTEEQCRVEYKILSELDECKIDYGITSKIEEDCKIDYKVGVKNNDCRIDFKTYIRCREFGLTYDTIKLILQNKLNLVWRRGKLYLQGVFGDYSVKGLTKLNLKNLTNDMRGEFLEDPMKFIKKYFSDYNLPNHIINKILE